jgi:antitoxin component YwqK of YwqJK toxin-antitoxin module
MNQNYKITIILTFLTFLISCQKDKSTINTELNTLNINAHEYIKIDTSFYENGAIEKLRFVKSDKDYIALTFYESGKKKSLIPVKNSQIHGECTDWYENGQIKWKRFYDAGNSIKQKTTYDENGNKTTIYDSTDDSFTEFYENGKPRLKTTDKLHIDYYLNGQIKNRFIFQADSTITQEYYHENGRLSFEGYVDSKFILFKGDSLYTGMITAKFIDGEIAFQLSFIKGRPDGKCVSRYGNKNLEYELEFDNGKEVGIHKRYYPNGNIQSINNFETKEYKEWDKKGNLVE